MKILHLLSAGTIGGIEILCRDIADKDPDNHVFAFLFHGGPVEEQIVDTGACVHKVYQTNRWNIGKFVRQLAKICREEQITIVVVHHEGISTWMYYLLLKKKIKNIKYIRYIHSVFEEKYYYTKNPVVNLIKREVLQHVITQSDKLIAVSECVKKSIEQHFRIEKNQIEVVYNGMREAQILHNREQSRIQHKGIRLIYMGRLVEVKGIDVLLNAFAIVAGAREEISLYILGDGEERRSLERMTEQLGLGKKVFFEGFQLEKENYLLESDIFVYPSRWQEAFGISIIEAMSYGLVCIASNVGGIPEIIKDGQNGYLYQNEDSGQLADRIQQAMQRIEDKQIEDLQNQATATASRYTIEKTMHQLQEIYNSLWSDGKHVKDEHNKQEVIQKEQNKRC